MTVYFLIVEWICDVASTAISHFLKLVDLVFQQAAIVIGNGAKPSISGFGVYWRVKAEMG
jgi:hypothetical protein